MISVQRPNRNLIRTAKRIVPMMNPRIPSNTCLPDWVFSSFGVGMAFLTWMVDVGSVIILHVGDVQRSACTRAGRVNPDSAGVSADTSREAMRVLSPGEGRGSGRTVSIGA